MRPDRRSFLGKFAFLFVLFACCLLPSPATAQAIPGGGDSDGADILPAFAAVSLEGPFELVTFDGATWRLVDDAVVEAAAKDAIVTGDIAFDDAGFLEVGRFDEETELAVIAAVASLPARFSPSPPTFAPDTHPAPAEDTYNLKKTIKTRTGEKEIYKTLHVPRRSGETDDEFQRRSERELRAALDAGWTSIP